MSIGDRIFGFFLDWSMQAKAIARERPAALRDARGEVLELGFGTGLNLPYYPPAVERLTVVDPEEFMPQRVEQRIAAAPFPVVRKRFSAERLPFADASFDCAVSTFTLCSIPDVVAAVREVRRVLKPGGSLFFLEHGLSDQAGVVRWQHWLEPVQKVIGRGCHLTRRIDQIVRDGGLEIARLERFTIAGPRTHGSLYRGAAVTR